MRLKFNRSDNGYGWSIMLHIRDKHRARWNSTKGTTRMWPRITYGADENCNRATTFVLWPIGHLDIWWEPNWRPEGSGICDKCIREWEAMDA